jgi:hypothetical protein
MRYTIVFLMLLSLGLSGYGYGTEQFIPMGQSPGVSGKLSLYGFVTYIDYATRAICVDGKQCFIVSADMPIYIDRSVQQRSNTLGTWDDLTLGSLVEIYANRWVKVAAVR